MVLTGSLWRRIPEESSSAVVGPCVIALASYELKQGLSSMEREHVTLSSRAENDGQAADAPAIHQATERARAFAAGWLAHRARMEKLVAEYEALKSSETPEVSCSPIRGARS
jgi:hypothetical protein